MTPTEWLDRCAAQLLAERERYPHEAGASFDAQALAGDIAEAREYRDLVPEEAARRFMADSQ